MDLYEFPVSLLAFHVPTKMSSVCDSPKSSITLNIRFHLQHLTNTVADREENFTDYQPSPIIITDL